MTVTTRNPVLVPAQRVGTDAAFAGTGKNAKWTRPECGL